MPRKRDINQFWSDDPIQTFLDAADEKQEVIVLPRKFVESLAYHIKELQKDLVISHSNEIWGFYEDEYPVYTSREKCHPELSSPMSVHEANYHIEQLKELYRLARLRTPR